MLGTTLTLTLATTGVVVLNRINNDNFGSTYLFKDADHQYVLKVRHTTAVDKSSKVKYDRHNVEIVETIWATATVPEFHRKFYFVVEQLPSDVEVEVVDGIADAIIATSNALLTELFGWQI